MTELKVPSLNIVVLGGRLTKDPEIRYTPSGTAVCNFSLAASRWRKKNDEWEEETCFIDCVCFGGLAERTGENLTKGSPVTVEGRLETRTWDDKSGNRRSKIGVQASRVQILEKQQDSKPSKPKEESEAPPPEEDEGDGLPF